ncbi:UvrB/UvrC motif-containing protein [candidate division KSB1 bacterium]|nr:UvrB/UvrC motif-containing protein [candidate division KSB1 bacterium]
MEFLGIDICPILRYWDYLFSEMAVRRLEGEGCQPQVEISIAGGMIRLNALGKPVDVLDYTFESCVDRFAERTRTDERIDYTEQEINDLQQEIVLYNARSLALLKIEDYYSSHVDTVRNLQAIECLVRRSPDAEFARTFLAIRPQLLVSYCRVLVLFSIKQNRISEARRYIAETLQKIHRAGFPQLDSKQLEGRFEIKTLKQWDEEIQAHYPLEGVKDLRKHLLQAVRSENYEWAAILRDQIRAALDSRAAE